MTLGKKTRHSHTDKLLGRRRARTLKDIWQRGSANSGFPGIPKAWKTVTCAKLSWSYTPNPPVEWSQHSIKQHPTWRARTPYPSNRQTKAASLEREAHEATNQHPPIANDNLALRKQTFRDRREMHNRDPKVMAVDWSMFRPIWECNKGHEC